MKLFDNLKAALTLKRGADQFQKDRAMNNYEPLKSLKAGVTQILTLVLTAVIAAVYGVLSDSEAIKKLLLGAGVNEAYVGVILLVLAGALRVAQNWYKHSPSSPAKTPTSLVGLVAIFLIASPANAQANAKRGFSLSLETGLAATWTEGVKDERAGVIITADLPVKRGGIATRIDIAGSRGQTAVDLTNPSTFRSTEILSALYYEAKGGVDAICFGGVSYSLEGTQGRPVDGRMYTGGCGGRVRLAGHSLVLGYGQRGAINGRGLLGSLTVRKGEKGRMHVDGALAERNDPVRGRAWELRSSVTYVPWAITSK